MKQIALPIGVESTRTFDTFVAGMNAAAVEHLRTLAAPAAPVYLWGPAGSGKTHLLRATAERVRRRAAASPGSMRRRRCRGSPTPLPR